MTPQSVAPLVRQVMLALPLGYFQHTVERAGGIDDDAVLHGLNWLQPIACRAILAGDRDTYLLSIRSVAKAGVDGAGRGSGAVVSSSLRAVGTILHAVIRGIPSPEDRDLLICMNAIKEILVATIQSESAGAIRSGLLMNEFVGDVLGASSPTGLSALLGDAIALRSHSDEESRRLYLRLLKAIHGLYRSVGEIAAQSGSDVVYAINQDVLEGIRQINVLLQAQDWAEARESLIEEGRWLKAVWVFMALRARVLKEYLWSDYLDGLLYAGIVFARAGAATASKECGQGLLTVAANVGQRGERSGPDQEIGAALRIAPLLVVLRVRGLTTQERELRSALRAQFTANNLELPEGARRGRHWLYLVEQLVDPEWGSPAFEPWRVLYQATVQDIRTREYASELVRELEVGEGQP